MTPTRAGRVVLLALLLGLPALLAQLSRPVPRLGADALEYYAHLRSLYFDGDVDFANEFAHFGILDRWDKIRPTPTGHRRTIFSVGPALLWMPFYAAGDAAARLAGDVQEGYSPAHIRAACLGSLAYGVAGLLLVHGILVQLVPRPAALWTVALTLYATFLWWYVVVEPLMSHAGSFFMAALALRVWWDGRERLTWRRAAVLGLVIGLGATVRWQNGVLLLLPALGLLPRFLHAVSARLSRTEPRPTPRSPRAEWTGEGPRGEAALIYYSRKSAQHAQASTTARSSHARREARAPGHPGSRRSTLNARLRGSGAFGCGGAALRGVELAGVALVALSLLAAFVAGTLPQMLAWKAVFGTYLLADPPHGRDFLRLGHPYLLETFFSSRHGLFYWTPILWAAYLGLVAFTRRDRRTGLTLLAPVLVMTYVNVCSGDWWAGGSFSNRRFDSLLPLLAVGLATVLAALLRAAARRPAAVVAAAGLALAGWNLLFMQQYRRNMLPRDDTVDFARVAANNAALLSDAVGTPLAWPANWIFAARHGLPAARYDAMVGKYLFYRQEHLGGVVDLGDARADPALLDDGWTSLRSCGPGAVCRAVRAGGARLFAPLDVPETLDVTVHARGVGTLRLAVNGAPVADFPLSPHLAPLTVRVPAERWQRELNELRFDVAYGHGASIDKVVFTRLAR